MNPIGIPVSDQIRAHDLNTIKRLLDLMAEKDAEIQRLRGALAWVYDQWENGDSCYECPEDCTGYMGRAFKIESEEENIILDLIGECEAALPPKRDTA